MYLPGKRVRRAPANQQATPFLRKGKNKTCLVFHLLNVIFLLHYMDFMEHDDYIYAHPS